MFLPQTGNVHTFTYDGSGGRRGGEQYTVVRRPDVLVQASHHVLDSGETIVIPGTLASTPLSSSNLTSHHNIDDGQVANRHHSFIHSFIHVIVDITFLCWVNSWYLILCGWVEGVGLGRVELDLPVLSSITGGEMSRCWRLLGKTKKWAGDGSVSSRFYSRLIGGRMSD